MCLFSCCSFSFNVSRKYSSLDAYGRGDCHQFASWHLNHLLQIHIFEMQINCICPDKLKNGESKHFWSHNFRSGFFAAGSCTVKRSFRWKANTGKITPLKANLLNAKWLYIYLWVCSQGKRTAYAYFFCFFVCLALQWIQLPLGHFPLSSSSVEENAVHFIQLHSLLLFKHQ